MILGYAWTHTGGTYFMYKEYVVISLDIIYLNNTYGEYISRL